MGREGATSFPQAQSQPGLGQSSKHVPFRYRGQDGQTRTFWFDTCGGTVPPPRTLQGYTLISPGSSAEPQPGRSSLSSAHHQVPAHPSTFSLPRTSPALPLNANKSTLARDISRALGLKRKRSDEGGSIPAKKTAPLEKQPELKVDATAPVKPPVPATPAIALVQPPVPATSAIAPVQPPAVMQASPINRVSATPSIVSPAIASSSGSSMPKTKIQQSPKRGIPEVIDIDALPDAEASPLTKTTSNTKVVPLHPTARNSAESKRQDSVSRVEPSTSSEYCARLFVYTSN